MWLRSTRENPIEKFSLRWAESGLSDSIPLGLVGRALLPVLLANHWTGRSARPTVFAVMVKPPTLRAMSEKYLNYLAFLVVFSSTTLTRSTILHRG
jgi:hypothetical protein